MPVYVAQCPGCERTAEYVRCIAEHFKAPKCDGCGVQMQQILTPVRGFVDMPAYRSPIDGREVRGRAARREDLKRNNCRPYEGREQEEKVAAKHRAEQEKKFDEKLTDELSAGYETLSADKRAALEHLVIENTTKRE